MKNIGETFFNAPEEIDERLIFLEDSVRGLNENLQFFFLQGRLRTDRPAPTSSTDVIANTDLLYDRVVTASYEYILVNYVPGGMTPPSLQWRRTALSTF